MAINISNILWLARRQMQDNATAYLYSAIYFLVMGFVLSSDRNWGVEVAFPIIMFILIQPSLSPKYMTFKKDNEVVRHQIFLHSLPIGFTNIIAARVLTMLAAGLINIPLFFLPFWIFGEGWNTGGNFIAWMTLWCGLALVGTGLTIYQEFRMSVMAWTKVNFVVVFAVMGAIILVLVFTDIEPVRISIELSNSHPWLLVMGGLVAGVAGLLLAVGRSVEAFRRREFAT